MVEHKDDKLGGANVEWRGGEKLHWERMKGIKRLFDPLDGLKQSYKGIWFTWCKY